MGAHERREAADARVRPRLRVRTGGGPARGGKLCTVPFGGAFLIRFAVDVFITLSDTPLDTAYAIPRACRKRMPRRDPRGAAVRCAAAPRCAARPRGRGARHVESAGAVLCLITVDQNGPICISAA